MIKNICVLGINNSLGILAKDFFKNHSKKYCISSASYDDNCDNLDEFIDIVNKYDIESVFIEDSKLVEKLELKIKAEIFTDFSIFIKSIKIDEVISALSGILSVKYILSSIYEFKDINLLNISPLLYSGKIIPKEAKTKGVNLKVYSYPAYSLDWFLSTRKISEIYKISLLTSVSNNKLINPEDYNSLIEYTKHFYSNQKIRLANDTFLISYLYDLDINKFWFYEQSMRFISVAVRFNDGSNLIHSATKNIDSIFNFHFLRDKLIADDEKQYEDVTLRIKKFDFSKHIIFSKAIECLEKKGSMPILFYLICEFFTENNYKNKFKKNTKLITILEDVLEKPEFFEKYPDLSTIYALDKKVKKYISNKYFKTIKQN